MNSKLKYILVCISCLILAGALSETSSISMVANAKVTPDWDIVCEKKDCVVNHDPSGPLFAASNIKPGDSFSKTIRIENAFKKETCYLHTQLIQTVPSTQNLFEQLTLTIQKEDQALASFSLQSYAESQSGVYFDALESKSIADYAFTIELPRSATNSAQGDSAIFDLNISVQCLNGPLPTPKPSARPPEPPAPKAPTKPGEVLGTENTSATIIQEQSTAATQNSFLSCQAQLPASAPIVRVSQRSSDAVTLMWTASAPVTGYIVEFANTDQFNQYRHAGITSQTYLIGNLSKTQPYYFRVIPVHDCAVGTASNTVVIQPFELPAKSENQGPENVATLSANEIVESASRPMAELTSTVLGAEAVEGALGKSDHDNRVLTAWLLVLIFLSLILVVLGRRTKRLLAISKKHLIVILGSAVLLFGGLALSAALFSDTETNSANIFTAGTLSLAVSGAQSSAFDNFKVTQLGTAEAIRGGKTWTVTNTGSIPGRLLLSVQNLKNQENGCNEAESSEDVSCEDPGANLGELGSVITSQVFLSKSFSLDEEVFIPVIDTNFALNNEPEFLAQWLANDREVLLAPGESVLVSMTWQSYPLNYTNKMQGDSVEFDLQFDLIQL